MKTILFLCTGNSCRSQMAEGFAKKFFPDSWAIYSAGTRADGLNSYAVSVMKEVGIDISKQYSKTIDSLDGIKPDYVITLCSSAAAKCPFYPTKCGREDWNLKDPADAKGSEEEKLGIYREVRDIISSKLQDFLSRFPC